MTMPAPPSSDAALCLDQQLCFALYAAANRIQRLYRPLLAALGLTYPQYLVMLVLWQHGVQSVGELGQRLHLDSGTLTPLLKRLQAAGLIERQRSAHDERRVLVRTTAEGAGLKTRAASVPQKIAALTTLDPTELADLRGRVQQLLIEIPAPLGPGS
jgi:DNA-binding MarR family transcriptional regulator